MMANPEGTTNWRRGVAALFVTLALILLYVFSGQFAIFAAIAEINAELAHIVEHHRPGRAAPGNCSPGDARAGCNRRACGRPVGEMPAARRRR